MQGGMVSAMTADAASSATVEPGFCPDLREAGTSTAPTAATSAIFEPEMPENSTRPERAAAWVKLRQAAAGPSSRNISDPTTMA